MGFYLWDRIERVVCGGLYFDMEEEWRVFLSKEELGDLRYSRAGLDARLKGFEMIMREREEEIWKGSLGSSDSEEWRKSVMEYVSLLVEAVDKSGD